MKAIPRYSKSAKSPSSGVSKSHKVLPLTTSPCRPDDNNRLESSSKGAPSAFADQCWSCNLPGFSTDSPLPLPEVLRRERFSRFASSSARLLKPVARFYRPTGKAPLFIIPDPLGPGIGLQLPNSHLFFVCSH